MTKRILCRVIKTAVLSESGDTLSHAGQLINKRFQADDALDVDVEVRGTAGWVTYTRRLDISRISVGGRSTGQILDYHT